MVHGSTSNRLHGATLSTGLLKSAVLSQVQWPRFALIPAIVPISRIGRGALMANGECLLCAGGRSYGDVNPTRAVALIIELDRPRAGYLWRKPYRATYRPSPLLGLAGDTPCIGASERPYHTFKRRADKCFVSVYASSEVTNYVRTHTHTHM